MSEREDEAIDQKQTDQSERKASGFMGVFSAIGRKSLIRYLKGEEVRSQIQDFLEQQAEILILGKANEVKASKDAGRPRAAEHSKRDPRRQIGEQYEDLAETDEVDYEEYHSTISESTKIPDEIRATPLYHLIRRNVDWQRDNYLIGQKYAAWRMRERANDTFYSKLIGSQFIFSRMPNTDPHALGFLQITDLASSFIPSTTVYNSALPLVSALPYGVLREPAYEAMANLIPASQKTLDDVVKTCLIDVFHNEDFKALVSSSFRNQAEGYLFKNLPVVDTERHSEKDASSPPPGTI